MMPSTKSNAASRAFGLMSTVRAHWGIENRAHYVREVTLGEDASRIRTRRGVIARIRSVALKVLRANGVQNVSLALYTNAVRFDQPLALGTAYSKLSGPA